MRNKMKIKTVIGLAAAVVGTILGIMGIVEMFKSNTDCSYFLAGGFTLSIVSYVLAGGFLCAVQAAKKITTTAWILIPVFPANLVVGLFGFFYGLLLFMELPIVFVIKNLKNSVEYGG